MFYENLKFAILMAEEVPSINFTEVCETSEDTLRWNIRGTKTFVKFSGPTPSWLAGKTFYDYTEMIAILNSSDGGWVEEE